MQHLVLSRQFQTYKRIALPPAEISDTIRHHFPEDNILQTVSSLKHKDNLNKAVVWTPSVYLLLTHIYIPSSQSNLFQILFLCNTLTPAEFLLYFNCGFSHQVPTHVNFSHALSSDFINYIYLWFI
jgi:hypothetical protein